MLRPDGFGYCGADEVLAGIFAKAIGLWGKQIVRVDSTYQGGKEDAEWTGNM